MIHVARVARGNDVAGARMLARDARRAPPGLGAERARAARACARRCARRGAVRGRSSRPRSARRIPAGAPAALRRRSRGRCSSATRSREGAERVLVLPARRRGARPARRARERARRHSRARPAPARRPAAGRRAARRARPARRRRDRRRARRGARGRRGPRVRRVVGRAPARGRRRRGASSTSPGAARASPLAAALRRVRRRRAARGPRLRRLVLEPPRAPARATRGWCASPASAPTGRGGCPSTPRARWCSTTRCSSEAAGRRAQALLDAGWVAEAESAGGARELPNGLVWDERLRRLHAEALDAGEDFGDIYSPAGARAFAALADAPGEPARRPASTRTRSTSGASAATCATPSPTSTARTPRASSAGCGSTGARSSASTSDLLPPPPAGAEARPRVPPVLVTGYLRGNLGLGEAARGYTAALQAAGVPVATRRSRPSRRSSGAARARRPQERAFDELALPDGERARGQPAVRQRRPAPRARRAGRARRRCARATRSASGRGRPTRSRRAGTARSTSSTRSGSTRPTSPRTSRARPTSTCPSSSCRCR